MNRYKLNKGFISQKVNGKITIFDGERSQLLTFNESASFIFGLIKKALPDEKIVESVVKKYKIGKIQALDDLKQLISELKKLDIIR